MMQQVATLKSESAASSLPLDIATSGESKQAFNEVMGYETQRTSAFEQAKIDTNKSASKQDARVDRQQKELASQAAENRADRSHESHIHKQAEQAQVNHKADLPNSADKSEHSDIELSESTNENSAKLPVKTENDNPLVDVASEDDGDFDYIAYVTKLAEFGGNNSEAYKNVMTSKDISMDAITQQNIESGQEEVVNLLLPINSDASNQEASEFLTISLNKQDLQTILDAQNAQLDLNAGLSEDDLQKLQDVITSMLGQLEQQDTYSKADADSAKQADKALMESLLLGQQDANNDAGASLANAQTQAQQRANALDENLASIEATKQSGKQASSDAISEFEKRLNATKASDLVTQSNAQAQNEKIKNTLQDNDAWHSTPDLEAKLPADKGIWSKTPDTSIKPGNELVKSPINNLAALNEEQTTAALNNISERVQSIVSDLNTPAKGNEFVAALQLGVKEFKQQLVSGREPGIDLKSLINDAIASTNTELEAAAQPKIDAAISQVNNLLNLANVLNQSASQQQTSLLSAVESPFAKEMNIIQTEGTKLANSVSNQLNTPANADKAFNIMKAEGQNQLAEKVRWMVNARNPSAEIRLDPPDLGGMQIKVNLSGDTAQVNFSVQSAAAKEVLDQAAPRLRDMLAQQGIELGQSSVQQESRQQQSGQQGKGSFEQGHAGTASFGGGNDAPDDMNNHVVEQRISGGALGGIDYYA